MKQTLREFMTDNPAKVDLDTSLAAVAPIMRDRAVGNVLVTVGDDLKGIVTDRDVVVRAIAEGMDPQSTTVEAVYSGTVVTASPDTPVNEAVRLMREHAVRRLPVIDGNRPLGIVSIGDLAMYRDDQSALADISAAPPNG
ncbi:MAG TPA: CBS domain-containing protein [Acidimicrobiia bacterium]|nr:CBS domain-containing protein [Acidimicrobiia bacterium]